MKQYQTKTGVTLTCIQGEGLGDGIRRGCLMIADAEVLEARSKDIGVELGELWDRVGAKLSLKQYKTTMFGDMRYASKAERAMRVSKNKTVTFLCKRIIELDVELNKILAVS